MDGRSSRSKEPQRSTGIGTERAVLQGRREINELALHGFPGVSNSTDERYSSTLSPALKMPKRQAAVEEVTEGVAANYVHETTLQQRWLRISGMGYRRWWQST